MNFLRRFRIKTPTWVKIALVLFVLLFGTQIPSCTMAYNPKFGRVVDVTTGKGIANVPVIAFATFNAAHLVHGSIQGCPYRVIAHTDADGRYWIPPMWLHARLGMPGTGPITRWQITAFKPGYAIEGDEKAWTFDEYGWPKDHPASRAYSHPGLWLGLLVRVDPIQMKPVQLNLKEAAVYYSNVIRTGGCMRNSSDPDEIALRKIGYQIFLTKVCNEDPEREMDSIEVGGITDFALNETKSFNRLKQLEPEMIGKEMYARPKYRAKNVCQAMIAGGEAP